MKVLRCTIAATLLGLAPVAMAAERCREPVLPHAGDRAPHRGSERLARRARAPDADARIKVSDWASFRIDRE